MAERTEKKKISDGSDNRFVIYLIINTFCDQIQCFPKCRMKAIIYSSFCKIRVS